MQDFTRSLAVEDVWSKQASSGLLRNVGVVQLREAAGRRQEQVPQSGFSGSQLPKKRTEDKRTELKMELLNDRAQTDFI